MPVIEEPQANGQIIRRYMCDRCGSGCIRPFAPGPILCTGCQPPLGADAFRESMVELLREQLTDIDLRLYSGADDPNRNLWVGIKWPGWAVKGAVVYHREAGYRAFHVTEVLPGSLKLSEVDPPNDNMTLHIVYHDAENLDREWAPVIPPTAWERLLKGDP